jgi:hypothetical protein
MASFLVHLDLYGRKGPAQESEGSFINQTMQEAYKGLLAGSEKHLRPHVNALAEHKIMYKPQHLSQEEYDRIVKLHKSFIFQEQELKELSKRGV